MTRRPKGYAPQNKVIQTMLTEATHQDLLDARDKGQGVSSIARDLIREGLEQRGYEQEES